MPEENTLEEVRVVIVDDHPDFASTLQSHLEDDGYTVAIAETGEDGLQLAASSRPMCVLLDFLLPGMDGAEVASRLRAQHGGDLVIVATTGVSKPEEHDRLERAGADYVLVKPVDLEKLRRLLPRLHPA